MRTASGGGNFDERRADCGRFRDRLARLSKPVEVEGDRFRDQPLHLLPGVADQSGEREWQPGDENLAVRAIPGSAYSFGHLRKSPARAARSWPDRPPGRHMTIVCVALVPVVPKCYDPTREVLRWGPNVASGGLWLLLRSSPASSPVPPALRTRRKRSS
jgi:hypothetical protein